MESDAGWPLLRGVRPPHAVGGDCRSIGLHREGYANIRVVTAIAFSLIFGVLAGNGATRPDPGGWQGTRWGMSDEEIMTAMKGDAKRITSEGWRIAGAKVGIDSWTIGSHPYHVNFISDDGGLRR